MRIPLKLAGELSLPYSILEPSEDGGFKAVIYQELLVALPVEISGIWLHSSESGWSYVTSIQE